MKLLFALILTFSLSKCFPCDNLDDLYKMVNELQKENMDELSKCINENDFYFYLGQFGANNRILRCIDALKMKENSKDLKEKDDHQRAIDELSN